MNQKTVSIGEFFATGRPFLLNTNCNRNVAVIAWDPKSRFTALCNYASPRVHKADIASACYGNAALKLLIKTIDRALSKSPFKFYLIGGNKHSLDDLIGKDNIDIARKIIAEAGFEIASETVGGTLLRSVQFDTETGNLAILKRKQ